MPNELVGGFVRIIQGLGWSCPTLLVGLLVSGVFRYYLGPAGTRRLFGGESIRSLPQSWLMGMLLPVCSIGVIPILVQMRQAKVRPGAMTAFALSAPLFNPLSLLYGITLSRPIVVLTFAALSLLLVTVLGALWDKLSKATDEEDVPEESQPRIIGGHRLAGIFIHMCRETCGPAVLYALVAVSGLGLLGSLIPFGDLQTAFEQDDPLAPARMVGLAVPVYATPMLAMTQLGMMFSHANSPGAALGLLLLGTGLNPATVLWMGLNFGFRSTALWFVGLILLVLGMVYAIDRPLVPPGVEPAGHTHAFDIYSNPFHKGEILNLRKVREKIEDQVLLPERIAALVLAGFAVIGLILRLTAGRVDPWLEAGQREPTATGLGRRVPAPVLGVAALVGLVAVSIVMCFAYYPAAEDSLEEIKFFKAETLAGANSGSYEHALHHLEHWDEWTRRLEVGTFLRSGKVRPYQHMQAFIVRKKLELLEHELEEKPPHKDEIKELVKELAVSSTRMRNAFLD